MRTLQLHYLCIQVFDQLFFCNIGRAHLSKTRCFYKCRAELINYATLFWQKPAFLGLPVCKDSVSVLVSILHQLCVCDSCLWFLRLGLLRLFSYQISYSWGSYHFQCIQLEEFYTYQFTLVRANWGVSTLASHPIYQDSCLFSFVLVWATSNSTNIKMAWSQ